MDNKLTVDASAFIALF